MRSAITKYAERVANPPTTPAPLRHRENLLPECLKSGLEATHLPALGGLRAVAAFLVVFYHFGIQEIPGGLGVIIFFVLSGFLITWLLLVEDEKLGKVSLREFYIRRSLRIAPAFYCYWLSLVMLLLLLDKKIVWPQAIASLFYMSNYYQAIQGDPNTGLSHACSLAIEEQFYLLWPLAFLALRRSPARMAKVLLGVILTVWVYRGVLHFGFAVSQGYIYEAFDTRADHLMIGCLLAVGLRSGSFPAFWKIVCSGPLMGVLTTGLFAASVVAENLRGASYRDTVGFIVNPLLSAVAIAQLIAFRGTPLWGWLNWGWMQYLGRISYSIYLYQQILVEQPKKALAAYPAAIQLAGCVAAIVGVASLSYFFIESPFLKLRHRLAGKARHRSASSSLPGAQRWDSGARAGL